MRACEGLANLLARAHSKVGDKEAAIRVMSSYPQRSRLRPWVLELDPDLSQVVRVQAGGVPPVAAPSADNLQSLAMEWNALGALAWGVERVELEHRILSRKALEVVSGIEEAVAIHQGGATTRIVAISPSGLHLVLASSFQGKDSLLACDLAGGDLRIRQLGRYRKSSSCSLSKDGEFACIWDSESPDGVFEVVDWESLAPILKRNDIRSACYAWAVDRIVTLTSGGGLEVWDISGEGAVLAGELRVDADRARPNLRASADGRFCSWLGDGLATAFVFHVQELRLIASQVARGGPFAGVAVTAGGACIVSQQGPFLLFSRPGIREVPDVLAQIGEALVCIAPHGGSCMTLQERTVAVHECPFPISGVGLSRWPSSKEVTGCYGGLQLNAAGELELVARRAPPLLVGEGPVSASVSVDSGLVALSEIGSSVISLVRAQSGAPSSSRLLEGVQVADVELSDDGGVCAILSQQNQVWLWSIADDKIVLIEDLGRPASFRAELSMQVASNGTRVAVSGFAGKVAVVDVDSGAVHKMVVESGCLGVHMAESGDHLVTVDYNQRAAVWSPNAGGVWSVMFELPMTGVEVARVAEADGVVVVMAGLDSGEIVRWSGKRGAVVARVDLSPHTLSDKWRFDDLVVLNDALSCVVTGGPGGTVLRCDWGDSEAVAWERRLFTGGGGLLRVSVDERSGLVAIWGHGESSQVGLDLESGQDAVGLSNNVVMSEILVVDNFFVCVRHAGVDVCRSGRDFVAYQVAVSDRGGLVAAANGGGVIWFGEVSKVFWDVSGHVVPLDLVLPAMCDAAAFRIGVEAAIEYPLRLPDLPVLSVEGGDLTGMALEGVLGFIIEGIRGRRFLAGVAPESNPTIGLAKADPALLGEGARVRCVSNCGAVSSWVQLD